MEGSSHNDGVPEAVEWSDYRRLCVEDWTQFYRLPQPRDEEGVDEIPAVELERVRDAVRALRCSLYRRMTFTAEQQLVIDLGCRYKAWFDAFAFQMLGESRRYKDVAEVIRIQRERGDEGTECH